ncbi:MAG: sigma 54-dependent Fis family transcriptional regulator [Myxococcota bacterium]|nr:sigma 54-dependent Fis family transcriptional regulator [Myxococcota bacterium]
MDPASRDDGRTERWIRDDDEGEARLEIPSIELRSLDGGSDLESRGAPRVLGAVTRTTLGAHPSNDVVLDDATVSRFHAEILVGADGVRVIDAGSSNGVVVDGVLVRDAFLREGSVLELGRVRLGVHLGGARVEVPLARGERFGELVGRSPRMRALFDVLERCAASDSTVLLEGETGTGKEAIAESLHRGSRRAEQPFVVLDCSAIPHELVESHLFGHERGSFTGAVGTRIGAFEEASGGTLFLDEIGELPTDLQPKLLRALEQRAVRRVGGAKRIDVDVRVIAATNRRLHEEVNAGRFRADLFYRLAVVRVAVPPLRERLDDLPLLIGALLERLGAGEEQRAILLGPGFLERLRASPWPGNVRELRNVLERFLVLGDHADEGDGVAPAAGSAHGAAAIDPRVSYQEARDRAIGDFERRYLEAVLALHEGNVAKAARESGLDRTYLHRLLRKHGLR